MDPVFQIDSSQVDIRYLNFIGCYGTKKDKNTKIVSGDNLMYTKVSSYYDTAAFGGLFNAGYKGKVGPDGIEFTKEHEKSAYLICILVRYNGTCNIYCCTFSFFKYCIEIYTGRNDEYWILYI
jgi:hypothetical protein